MVLSSSLALRGRVAAFFGLIFHLGSFVQYILHILAYIPGVAVTILRNVRLNGTHG